MHATYLGETLILGIVLLVSGKRTMELERKGIIVR